MHIVQTLQVYSDYSCFKTKRMSTGTHIEVLVDTTRSSLQHIHTDSAHTQIGSGVYKLF